MKENRNEEKDVRDVNIIKKVLKIILKNNYNG
jgi:hypothetical protein